MKYICEVPQPASPRLGLLRNFQQQLNERDGFIRGDTAIR